ncbi:MAG: hypothetical protein IPK19_16015 [Chloroflexi bacterium]|nr:hypothetical protein [Chloroflexota bacterium]
MDSTQRSHHLPSAGAHRPGGLRPLRPGRHAYATDDYRHAFGQRYAGSDRDAAAQPDAAAIEHARTHVHGDAAGLPGKRRTDRPLRRIPQPVGRRESALPGLHSALLSESQRRFPVLYLLPAAGENESQWDELGIDTAIDQGVRLGALPPMIVVMPALGNIGVRNSFPPNASYETYLMDELRPAVERDFCTITTREERAIGGIGRSGFWAYSIALRNPDTFSIVGGHSADFDAANVPPANNPLELALDAPFLQEANLRMFIDNGAEDPDGAGLGTFSSRLSARGITHTYVITPGEAHDESYWSNQLDEYLTFYAADWERDLSVLPSCLEPSP